MMRLEEVGLAVSLGAVGAQAACGSAFLTGSSASCDPEVPVHAALLTITALMALLFGRRGHVEVRAAAGFFLIAAGWAFVGPIALMMGLPVAMGAMITAWSRDERPQAGGATFPHRRRTPVHGASPRAGARSRYN